MNNIAKIQYSTEIPMGYGRHYASAVNTQPVAFKGHSENKSSSVLKTVFGLAVAGAAVVGGLAYAHKTDVLSKMKDGKIKDFLKKAAPAMEYCHNICGKVKNTSKKYYQKAVNFIKRK